MWFLFISFQNEHIHRYTYLSFNKVVDCYTYVSDIMKEMVRKNFSCITASFWKFGLSISGPLVEYVSSHFFQDFFKSSCHLIFAFDDYEYWHVKYDGCFIRGRKCSPFAITWVHPQFLAGSVWLIFSFLCYDFLFCFVCLRPVSCVPNIVGVSGLFILECTFDFI
jgi:hypothetical protein